MCSRRHFLKTLATALAAAPAVSLGGAGGTPVRPLPDGFTVLRRGVGTFRAQGGTIGWLIRNGALVVVDTQSPKTAPDCWSGLRDRTDEALDLVINTHHHGDHTGGNRVFAEHTDRIVAHENVPALMRQSAGDEASKTYPTETFETEWAETVGDETIALRYHGPAHTRGDAIIHFEKANVVHVGDLVFNRAYPYIDVQAGADSQNWIAELEAIYGRCTDDTIIIHGHANPEFGPAGNRNDLLVMRDFLAALNEYVQQQRQAGASLDEMKQKEALEGFEGFQFDWALSLGACIEAVYREQEG
ncbi:MAG: MBL fold metallo-hydrolase [Bacteroidetes bacterium SW_9_63_38]|nr:MAG: MBL fold metallo-hydrolase [Bacteroidetes bacterium SW_9_63_38]